jgi:hypothetical protein
MMGMIEDSDDSIAAATGYTDAFLDAAVSKIDATFGTGFARANPVLIGAMIQASAANLNAFMAAASNMPMEMFDMLPDDEFPLPPKKPKKGGR